MSVLRDLEGLRRGPRLLCHCSNPDGSGALEPTHFLLLSLGVRDGCFVSGRRRHLMFVAVA